MGASMWLVFLRRPVALVGALQLCTIVPYGTDQEYETGAFASLPYSNKRMIGNISIQLLHCKQVLTCCLCFSCTRSLLYTLTAHAHAHTYTQSACFRMRGGPFIIGGVLQLTNKYLEMKSSGQDMFTQTLLKDFMADVCL